jgi:SAM-dependent methyltransferase
MRGCEICGGNSYSLIATEIREGEGRIVQCDTCGLVAQDLDWDGDKLREYYEEEYQLTNSLVRGTTQTAQEHFQDRLKTVNGVFQKVRPLLKKHMAILEVGSGPGALLSLCRPHVKRCVGIELNTEFVRFMTGALHIDAYADDVHNLKIADRFDLIIMIATLDHLPTPLRTLETLRNMLTEKGRLYVEVPNREEALNFFVPEPNLASFRKFFWHRAHFFYFTKKTITALFQKAGFSVRISCRHDYTLKNYLNWYFLGQPQPGLVIGTTEKEMFPGSDPFETRMNALFRTMDREFRQIMSETFRGDNLCCIGKSTRHD